MGRLFVRGGRVVMPGGVAEADLAAEDGRIVAVGAGAARDAGSRPDDRIVDAEGQWVLPGLVDLHCDAIEKEAEPRPNTLFPLEMAFLEFEKKLAGHGITTMLHSLSLGVGLSLRGEHLVAEMIGCIHALRQERAMIRHGVHLRYEVSHLSGLPLARRLIEEGAVHLFSLMDHAPGIGQYKKPGSFERYVMKNQGVTIDEAAKIVEELQERRRQVDPARLRELTDAAAARGVTVASHDDDSHAAVEKSLTFRARICEFPLDLETAAYARRRGMDVAVGAPNVVRGGSHDGNLRAIDAVRAGAANILCSDYHPASLLHALFILHRHGMPLHEAAALASLHPARAIGRDDEIGSLEPGKRADFIVVREVRGWPLVVCTAVNGTVVHQSRDMSGYDGNF
jgi:alpha-D-ribose 1-methylphosphonate 5-triphosphate diphosphatase